MNYSMETTFIAMLSLAVIFICLILFLFQRIKAKHVLLFKKLGSPNLLKQTPDKMAQTIAELPRFLLSEQHKKLNDSVLTIVVYLIRVFFITYLGIFIWMAIRILSGQTK
jgi:hypothetical protein